MKKSRQRNKARRTLRKVRREVHVRRMIYDQDYADKVVSETLKNFREFLEVHPHL